MSKLQEKYKKLKEENIKTLYLFRCGVFYIALDKDAEILSEIFKFKITEFNKEIGKCGFPVIKIDYYTNLLNKLSVDYLLVDNICNTKSSDISQKIISKIKNINMLDTSPKKAYDILNNLKSLIDGKEYNE